MYYVIDDSYLTALANSIRKKILKSDKITLSTMPDLIRSIQGDQAELIDYINGTLSSVYTKKSVIIPEKHFAGFSTISIVSGECVLIESSAFYNCKSLISVSLPSCTSIGPYAFEYCLSLSNIDFSTCATIAQYAFVSCSSISSAIFPKCVTISHYAFKDCVSLETISFPICINISGSAFYNCSSLSEANFSACTTVAPSAFYSCKSLCTISFPACITIGSYAFQYCSSLEFAYFLGSSIPTLYSTAFYSTPLFRSTYLTPNRYGSIYVPESLVESYKSAPGWSYYSSRITAYIPSS